MGRGKMSCYTGTRMETLARGARTLGLELTVEQLDKFERYYRELIARNRDVNLTRITDREDVQVRHFLDSLSCLAVMGAPGSLKGRTVIDVGSGAGFPGLPVRIAAPGLRLTLLEATGKKADFLRDMVELLGLSDVDVVTGRAEELARKAAHRESYDFVLARAVAELPALAELMLPLCRTGGKCLALKKGDVAGEAQKAEKAVAVMGGRLAQLYPATIIPGETDRCIAVMEKTSTTPERYPRRSGMPVKRPVI